MLRPAVFILALAAALAAPAAAGTPSRRAVPILMYHVVQVPYARAPNPSLYVPKAEFAAQVRWLAAHGFHAMTLRQVWNAWHGRAPMPAKPIVFSFDDGYRSHYANARPVLHAQRWPGVLDLDLSNLSGTWGIKPRLVRGLIKAGWEIDAHSMTHADLRRLSGAALRREVAGSREAIRRRFGQPADFFCYPSGLYDPHVVAAVRAAGFLGATTVEFGLARASDPYALDRVRINRGDGVAGLRAKLVSLGVR
jgi:peptidoglycan/xylan/chitin deacetylase (PgdA/CDA1 family)